MSRRSSASVFGGSGMPSGVRSVARRSAALRRVGLKSRMPRRARVRLHPVDDARALADQALALAVRPLGILLCERRDRRHAAMAPFAAQPAEERALQQLGVEPVGLRPPMLARYGDARRMDDVRLDAARPQPARQPEAVAAGLEGDGNPRDRAAGLDRLIAPAMQQPRAAPSSSGSSFFSGWRSMPGTIPATSQLDWLISTTAMSVLSWSKAARDLLKSFGWGMGHSIGCCQRRWCHLLAACPIASSTAAPPRASAHRFARVIQQAVRTRPATYHTIVAATAS